jgi:hypothetical protein
LALLCLGQGWDRQRQWLTMECCHLWGLSLSIQQVRVMQCGSCVSHDNVLQPAHGVSSSLISSNSGACT